LARQLNSVGVAYIHIPVNPEVTAATLDAIRKEFGNTLIYNGNFTSETAEVELQKGNANLVAFGRSFLANPDFVERIITGAPLNQVDYTTLYTPGPKGYIDYPTMTDASERKILL
jgi:N-ethylmaleimide reductase